MQRILHSPDPDTRARLVADHLQRLESELDRTRAAVTSLRRLLQPEPTPLNVELRAVPAITVAAVEDDVEHEDVVAWYAGAMAELDALVSDPTGVPGGLYDNSLFEDGHGHVLVYRPTPEPPRSGRVHPMTLPAVELAATTHVGEHDDINVTYGELGAWVVANALAVAGPVREHYLVGPRDTGAVTAVRRPPAASQPAGTRTAVHLRVRHSPLLRGTQCRPRRVGRHAPPSTPFRHVK